MENRRAILISLICFSISIVLISAYVRVKRWELTKDFGEEVSVVVAAATIPEYGIIQKQMVTTITVFKNFKQPQTVADESDVIGKAAYVSIAPGEQITLTKLIHQDGRPVLDRQVEKKMRAVTFLISPQSGVGRLIKPGNHVDVIIAPNYDSGNGQNTFEVKTLIQNVLVLATGRNIQNEVPTRLDREVMNVIQEKGDQLRRKDIFASTAEVPATARPDDNYSNVTLQVAPEDASRLQYVTHLFGDKAVYLTLRNSADQKVDKTESTILDSILGPDSDYGRSKRKPPPAPVIKPRFYDSQGGQVVPVY